MATAVAGAEAEDEILARGADTIDAELLREAAQVLARSLVSDAVREVLEEYGGSLRDLHKLSGLEPATVSRLARGKLERGGSVATLAQVALALDKTLHIRFE